ncbi:MAG TPA: ABC transporter ATP-binding protein [Acidimicrobiales bacterium]|nr:ABC transporter ATP-binding protein [Acidimicrobiales bacterium]
MALSAIACHDVWKSYRVYHEPSHTLKEKVLFRRNRYEEFWALKGIDLEVPVGSTTGIIGANGSGKSTMLKTMARILTPNAGYVEVNGTMASLLELGIGFHPDLTGRENVFLSGSLLGRTRRDVAARYDEIVDLAGIEPFMDVAVKNYSTGMYARLAFAVAVSVEPEILLVDEVLSVGDEDFQMRCYDRISEFKAEGRTIVLVSHAMDSIRSLCDRAVWLEEGALREAGEAHDVVASYLGEVHGGPSGPSEGPSEERRFGSGEALLTDVVLLDGTGRSTSTFRTGEPLVVRMTYAAKEPLPNVLCSASVYRADGLAHLLGQNSRSRGLVLELSGRGVIEFTVPELPLLKGAYVLSVALHDDPVTKIYDWHDRAYSFFVVDNPRLPPEAGMVHVESRWRTWTGDPRAAAAPPAPEVRSAS